MFGTIKSTLARRPRLRKFLFGLLILLALPYAIAPFYRFFWPVSTQMIARRLMLKPVERRWLPLHEMSPSLVVAMVTAEDGRFCAHHGVDFGALAEAIEDAISEGQARGASTITMQVARNLFLWQGRSYLRKALELPLAIWIDLVLPKRRILEIYLNVAEFGEGVFGVAKAADSHLRKSARIVDANESALLAAVLPSPRRRNAGNPDPRHARLAGAIMARLRKGGVDLSCLVR